jgi:WD40 repeat protein
MALAPDSTLHDAYRITYVADDRQDSTIYRAMDRAGRRVLIAALLQADEEELNETRALLRQVATLKIEGLLPVLEHFAEQLTYYVVCEDPGGQDLERYVRERNGPLPEASVLSQMSRLLQTLEVLHDSKPPLFVGDLRPSDVWGDTSGSLRLAPFALARPIGGQDLGYRAPELNRPHEEPDAASDMYSFGVLYYQLLTGWLPPNAMQREAGTPLNAPRSLNGQISPLAEQAVLRSLELKKGNRYQAAREMRQALETVQMMAGRSLGLSEALPTGTVAYPERPPIPPPPVPPPPGYSTPAPQPQAPYPQPQAPYPQPQVNAPAYEAAPTGYAQVPYAPQAPARRQGNTCLIVVVALLALVALALCAALALVIFGPGRSLVNDLLGRAPAVQATAAPAPNAATGQDAVTAPATPAPSSNPNVIGVGTAGAITATQVFTENMAGPVLYSPDGQLLALGVGSLVTLRRADALETEEAELSGHTGVLNTLAFSPDGNTLASGAIDDLVIRLWDVASGKPGERLEGHQGWIRTLAYSPDGTILASGSTDKTIRLWDTSSGDVIRTLEGHDDFVSHLAFSPDGDTLASTSRDGTVRLWEVSSGKQRPEFSFTAPVNSSGYPPANVGLPFWMTGLSFSPDGALLAAGSIDGIVRVWEVASGTLTQTLEGHNDWVMPNMLAFSPDGNTLASGSLDGTVRLWDPQTGAARETLEMLNSLQFMALAWEPDGTRLATSSDEGGALLLWDVQSGEVTDSLRLGQGVITSLAYSPDNIVLGSGGVNGLVQLYQLEGGQRLTLPGAAPTSQALAFVDANTLVALLNDGSVMLVDLTQRVEPRQLEGLEAPALGLVVSPDGRTLAAGGADGTVALWETAAPAQAVLLKGLSDPISAMAISADGSLVAAGTSGASPQVAVFDARSGQRTQLLSGHSGPITALSFQPRGTLLASASRDGSLRLWNVENGNQISAIPAQPDGNLFTAAAFSSDGTLLVTGSLAGTIECWDAGTSELLHSLSPQVGSVLALALRPDGEQLSVSFKDGSVRLFEVKG